MIFIAIIIHQKLNLNVTIIEKNINKEELIQIIIVKHVQLQAICIFILPLAEGSKCTKGVKEEGIKKCKCMEDDKYLY